METYGDAISLDMGDGTAVSTSATLGVQAYTNWQYFSGESGTPIEDVEDDSGTVQTGTDITPANDAGSRGGNSSGSGAEYDMYARGLVIANSGNTTLAAVNIPYSKYNVYIYVDEHAFSNGGVTTSYSDGTTTYYSDIQGSGTALYSGSWVQVTDTSGSGGTGNYIVFSGLTSSSFTITMNSDGFSGTQISGMQIVERTDGSGHTATGAQTVSSPTQSGTGVMDPDGAGAQTAQSPTQAASGGETISGAAAQAVTGPAQAGSGAHTQGTPGTGSQTTPAFSQAGATAQTFTGAGSQTAQSPTQSSVGLMHPDGAATQTAQSPAQAGSGLETTTGTAAQTAASPTQAATGTAVDGAAGTGTQSSAGPTQAAIGVVTNIDGKSRRRRRLEELPDEDEEVMRAAIRQFVRTMRDAA